MQNIGFHMMWLKYCLERYKRIVFFSYMYILLFSRFGTLLEFDKLTVVYEEIVGVIAR